MKRQVWYPSQHMAHGERSVHKSSYYWLLCWLPCQRLGSGVQAVIWSKAVVLKPSPESLSGCEDGGDQCCSLLWKFSSCWTIAVTISSHSHFLNICFAQNQLMDAIDAVNSPVTKGYHYPHFTCSNAIDCVTWEAQVRTGILSNLLSLHYFPWA